MKDKIKIMKILYRIKTKRKCNFILEYDCDNNIINKKNIDLKELPYFDNNSFTDTNNGKIVFSDSGENIYVIEKNNFRISFISSEDI